LKIEAQEIDFKSSIFKKTVDTPKRQIP